MEEGEEEEDLGGSDDGLDSVGLLLSLEGVVGEEGSMVGVVVGVVVVDSRLVGRGSLMGSHIRTS